MQASALNRYSAFAIAATPSDHQVHCLRRQSRDTRFAPLAARRSCSAIFLRTGHAKFGLSACNNPETSSFRRPSNPKTQVHVAASCRSDAAAEAEELSRAAEAPRAESPSQVQPVASTSDRQQEDYARLLSNPKMARAISLVPLAALSLDSFKPHLQNLSLTEIRKKWRRLTDSANYANVLPPIGSQQLSYARLLDLLSHRQVKRIYLLDNGTCAIVEVPVEGYAASFRHPLTVDRIDETIQYQGASTSEWDMEKTRYYCELPGDVFEDGYFMDLVKVNMAPLRDEKGHIRHQNLLESDQTCLELKVVDTGEANVFLEGIKNQLPPIIGIVILQLIVTIGSWVLSFFQRDKTEMQDMIDEYSKFRGTLYNVEGGSSGTGVRFEDVAGVEHAMELVEETIEMLLGDRRYADMGAKAPRGILAGPARQAKAEAALAVQGILMEGPPGTGKTFLAKAMAGESKLPFISTNGSEFVEMFQGVAASRVRDLFKTARKVAPAIVFIDEVDAIGKARGEYGGGSNERESGLMQMLYEMDGFSRDDQVLIIGATNRRDALDPALLRPGRFDRTVHMGLPSTVQRFKILQVHARDKPIDRSGDERFAEDALLHHTAEMTIGQSGAELANLLNEAAILMVRKDESQISLALVREVLDKRVIGLASIPLPDSAAKQRLATVSAARAVVAALTPGLPPLQRMSIVPRGENMTRTLFTPQNLPSLHRFWQPGKCNAVELKEPLSPYELMTGMLVPLYAARAAEEAFYGPREVTLGTSYEIAEAGQLANYLVVKSSLFPAYRDHALSYDLEIYGMDDPTTARLTRQHERHILAMQRVAHSRALRLVRERRAAIEAVAAEMCANGDLIAGNRVVELVETSPVAAAEDAGEAGSHGAAFFTEDGAGRSGRACFSSVPAPAESAESSSAGAAAAGFGASGAGKSGQALFGSVNPRTVSDGALQVALDVLIGRLETADLTGVGMAQHRVDEVMSHLGKAGWADRVKAVRKLSRSVEADEALPPPPLETPEYKGDLLEDWVNPEAREPILA